MIWSYDVSCPMQRKDCGHETDAALTTEEHERRDLLLVGRGSSRRKQRPLPTAWTVISSLAPQVHGCIPLTGPQLKRQEDGKRTKEDDRGNRGNG